MAREMTHEEIKRELERILLQDPVVIQRAREAAIEKNVPILREAAERTLTALAGYAGGARRSNTFEKAVDVVYDTRIGRPGHPGGWADQSVWLTRYPLVHPVLRKFLKGRTPRVHAKPLREQYFYTVDVLQERGGQLEMFVNMGNAAFYASFLEKRGYRVTKDSFELMKMRARDLGGDVA